MSGHIIRLSALALLLITAFSQLALADENPYPRDWFWGDDDQRAVHDTMIGLPAPDLKLSDWINGEQTAKDLKGKIVVIDFWATWCGPCIRSIPHNNEVSKHYAEDGVLVVGVCGSSNGQERMGQVAEENEIAYPVAKDATLESAKAWNVMWWPTYAVVDRNGIVRAVGLKPNYIEDVVDSVLEEQPYHADDEDDDEDDDEVDD